MNCGQFSVHFKKSNFLARTWIEYFYMGILWGISNQKIFVSDSGIFFCMSVLSRPPWSANTKIKQGRKFCNVKSDILKLGFPLRVLTFVFLCTVENANSEERLRETWNISTYDDLNVPKMILHEAYPCSYF